MGRLWAGIRRTGVVGVRNKGGAGLGRGRWLEAGGRCGRAEGRARRSWGEDPTPDFLGGGGGAGGKTRTASCCWPQPGAGETAGLASEG